MQIHPKPVSASFCQVPISSNKSSQDAWKAPPPAICVQISLTDGDRYDQSEESNVSISDRRPVPPELHLAISSAFITDPQETNFQTASNINATQNESDRTSSSAEAFCLSVSSAFPWDINIPRCGRGSLSAWRLSIMTRDCDATALWRANIPDREEALPRWKWEKPWVKSKCNLLQRNREASTELIIYMLYSLLGMFPTSSPVQRLC